MNKIHLKAIYIFISNKLYNFCKEIMVLSYLCFSLKTLCYYPEYNQEFHIKSHKTWQKDQNLRYGFFGSCDFKFNHMK